MKNIIELSVDCGFEKDFEGNEYQEVECECCTQCFVDSIINRESDIIGKIQMVSPIELLENEQMPQFKALDWILNHDTQQIHPKNPGLVQRYIVALFGYALIPFGQFTEDGAWLSGVTECEWRGVICDEDFSLLGFDMGKQTNPFGFDWKKSCCLLIFIENF